MLKHMRWTDTYQYSLGGTTIGAGTVLFVWAVEKRRLATRTQSDRRGKLMTNVILHIYIVAL